MAIVKKWSHYTKENIKCVPNVVGVYELAFINTKEKTKKTLYHGEGLLRNRLLAHFPDGKRPEEIVVGANAFRFEIVKNKKTSLKRQNQHLEDHLDEHGKLPPFNKRSKN